MTETVKAMNEASIDGSFTIAQTAGSERRGDRRDTRQDCRQQNGAVGGDKRNCKQQDARISRGHYRTWPINVTREGTFP